jgi:hypothetical protein
MRTDKDQGDENETDKDAQNAIDASDIIDHDTLLFSRNTPLKSSYAVSRGASVT